MVSLNPMRFVGGVFRQAGAIARAKSREYDRNTARVIFVGQDLTIDPELRGRRVPGNFVQVDQLERTFEIDGEYKDTKGRITYLCTEGAFFTRDIQKTLALERTDDPTIFKDHTAKNNEGHFSQRYVSELTYRILSAKVNNMFEEPSYNFTLLACGFSGAVSFVLALLLTWLW